MGDEYRLGVVDVGSNAIRLLIVVRGDDGAEHEHIFHRFPLRLGKDVFKHGKLLADTQAELANIFEKIAQLLKTHRVNRYRAVATSAMRDATNSTEVVAMLKQHSGITLEVIDGDEEARLSTTALLASVSSTGAKGERRNKDLSHILTIDLGGGSLELSLNGIFCSLPLGSVRLLSDFPELGQGSTQETIDMRETIAQAYDKIKSVLNKSLLKSPKGAKTINCAVGTGGCFKYLLDLMPHSTQENSIDLTQVLPWIAQAAAMPIAERCKVYDIPKERADVVIPAALVLIALGDCYHFKYLKIPETGLREAMIECLFRQEQSRQ